MSQLVRAAWSDDESQGVAEYALLLAVVLVVTVSVVMAVGTNANRVLSRAAGALGNGSTHH
jgi:Flp pilus assembly pilin Flp